MWFNFLRFGVAKWMRLLALSDPILFPWTPFPNSDWLGAAPQLTERLEEASLFVCVTLVE